MNFFNIRWFQAGNITNELVIKLAIFPKGNWPIVVTNINEWIYYSENVKATHVATGST